MPNSVRMTMPTLKVLELFISCNAQQLAGSEIGIETKLSSGSLYPILHRLTKNGWLDTEKEKESPSELGRPQKTFYRLNADGRRQAISELAKRGYLGELPEGVLNGLA